MPKDVIVDTFDNNDLKVEARDQKFKASLQYIANLGPAQAMKSPTSKISKQITHVLVQVTQIKFSKSLKKQNMKLEGGLDRKKGFSRRGDEDEGY